MAQGTGAWSMFSCEALLDCISQSLTPSWCSITGSSNGMRMDVRLGTVGYDGSVQCTFCVLLFPIK